MVKPSVPPGPELSPDLPPPSWRRPLLLTMGVSMLGLGVYANAERLGLSLEEPNEITSEFAELEAPPREEEDEAGTRHAGAEGKMGKPTNKSKSGVYALKGPKDAIPQMARDFDSAARQAGILGVMQQGSGQFLASPYGGAYAVGNDDQDVWGGLTGAGVGEAYGVGGLGLVGTGRGGGGVGEGSIGLGNRGFTAGPMPPRDPGAERYAKLAPNAFVKTLDDAKSTFSIDVDTAAYTNVRRYLLESNTMPPPAAVRTEELINYFEYDYVVPSSSGAPFSVTTEVGPSVWDSAHRLVHVGIQAKIPLIEDTPARNLVFLLDVSGSMNSHDKLPLVKRGLARLTQTLDSQDRVSIVVYAGAAGAVLSPTSGSDKQAILSALDRLSSGGGTNGGEGIELAYALAERSFIEGGINRVILASDGDFNVGLSSHEALVELIEHKRESGVFLSVLGFGTGNYNDHTMEQLADKGNGNYAYIDGYAEAERVLGDQAGALLQTIAKDVKIQVEFDPTQVTEHRLVGYENRVLAHRDFDDDTKDAGEIGAGHSVTAIYEVLPSAQADPTTPLMSLSLRYKQPDAKRSRKLVTPVLDAGLELGESSLDYRFSAAVAAFAEALRGSHEELSYAEIFSLAADARGADTNCYRHQFLELVHRAGTLSDEQMEPFTNTCEREEARPRKRVVEVEVRATPGPVEPVEPVVHVHNLAQPERPEWMSFTLEVLRLLPPLLALPLFIFAARPPRRRKK